MLRFIAGFLFGCSTLFFLNKPLSTLEIVVLLSAFFIGLIITLLYKKQPGYTNLSDSKKQVYASFIVCVSALILGLVWASTRADARLESRQLLSEFSDLDVLRVTLEVSSIPEQRERYCQFDGIIKSAFFGEQETSVLDGHKLQLKHYQSGCSYGLGQLWSVAPKLKDIHAPVNDSGFDYERWMFEQNYSGKGYVLESSVLDDAVSYRQEWFERLDDLNYAGMFQGLILGEKQSISRQQTDLIRNLGLSHLMAISGLHIAIIAGFAFFTFLKLAGFLIPWLSSRKTLKNSTFSPINIAWVISCVVALLYSALADFSLPTIRAMMMWWVVALAQLSQWKISLHRSIGIAIFVVLLWDPISVLSISFWMTFIAVSIIAVLITGQIQRDSSIKGKILQLFRLQLALSLSLGLVSLLVFNEFSAIGLLVNMVAIPLFSLVLLPLIFVAVMMFAVGWKAPVMVVEYIFDGFFSFGEWALQAKDWFVLHHYISSVLLIVAFMALLVAFLPLKHLKRPVLVAALLMSFVASYGVASSNSSGVKVNVIDVGHGLAVLIYDEDSAVLYDTAYSGEQGGATESYVIPMLKQRGIHQLDALIISHSDADHASGLESILKSVSVKELVAGEWLKNRPNLLELLDQSKTTKLSLCQKSWSFSSEQYHLEALYPNTAHTNSESFQKLSTNNQSCVIKLTLNQELQSIDEEKEALSSILFAGDIEREAELELAESLDSNLLNADIVIAPHHGSKTSSSYPFLKRISPKMVVYSSEYKGRFKMPHPNVVKRYADFETAQYHTGCSGGLEFNLSKNSWRETRQSNPKVWRNRTCERF